jgi:hypothetical protein
MSMLDQQTVQGFFLSNCKLSRLYARVVDAEQRVHVVHRLGAHISELFDFVRGVFDLEMILGIFTQHVQ